MHRIFIDLDSIFGIYLHYLMFYAHLSPITLGFGLFRFLTADVLILSQVLGEKT